METIIFNTFLYITVFCFICCLRYNSNTASINEYNKIDLSPIWESQPSCVQFAHVNVDDLNSRQLRSLASEIKLSGYSRILRERKTEGLRKAIREHLQA